jgi:hypothetical protein
MIIRSGFTGSGETPMRHLDRRQLLAGALAGIPAATLASSAFGQRKTSPSEKSPSELITPETQRAIDRGLAFLARRQQLGGQQKGAFGTSGYPGGVAVAGLGGLAFMCGGSPPGQGPYGKNVDACAEFVMKCVNDNGYITRPGGHDNMYGHGFATLFLSEVYGMSMREEVGKKLRKAIKLIIDTQNHHGGWRYQPVKGDADLSITICQIMALRAARDAGVHVPDETRKKCIEYVKKSQNADGGFRYQVTGGGSTFPLTAAGLVSLYSAGIYDGPEVEKGMKHLMQYKPGGGRSASHYFYGHYYVIQATWHAGGTHWDTWYPAIRTELLRMHRSDGSWADSSVGQEFGTAMACIILQMPNNFLPVFAP